jgi:tricorn protease-like protein
LPTVLKLEDIAADGRVLVTLTSKRLAIGFSSLGNKEDVDLSWHDWNSARDISRDGQFVLFEDASEPAGPGYTVVVRKVDGSLPIQLGEGSAAAMSPDGKWAIAISTTQAAQLTLFPIRAGEPRVINVSGLAQINNGWSRFLSDGQRIAVIGNEAGHAARCYLVDLSNGRAKSVTPEGVICGPLSPDDRSLVGRGPNGSITIYSLDGGATRLIPNLEPSFTPVQWSTDGSSLYGYHMGEFPSNIYAVNIASGKETMLQQLRPGVPAGVVMIAPVVVSRDGRHFAYSYNQTLSVLCLISGLR